MKYIRNGYVAVLYSPGFGGGWQTWNTEHLADELLFDAGLIELVLDETTSVKQLKDYATAKWGNDIYLGGIEDLQVMWIPEGSEFRISEYDGAEHVMFKDDYNWFTA